MLGIKAFFGKVFGRGTVEAEQDEAALTLSADEIEELQSLCYHAKWMAHRWQRELGPALQALGSRHALECHEHIRASARLAHVLQRRGAASH